MSASEAHPFPLAGLQAVANARNEWVAVTLHLAPGAGDAVAALTSLLGYADAFAALAPLDCIVPLADPRAIDAELLGALQARRVIFSIPAAISFDQQVRQECQRLVEQGYRILVDGGAGVAAAETGARAFSFDCGKELPRLYQLLALPGPHLASGVDSGARRAQCLALGFAWIAGEHALGAAADPAALDDGTSRKRLLALLGLLARDADSYELETLLKQDPALSYRLLKLVNSASFAPPSPINSFAQAIKLLGRRQLTRWLQLLLYARQQDDGIGNALLPLAAVRAAQMEMLCKIKGGDRDQQDIAFMVGVFSLLDVLLGMPMAEIVGALKLSPEVDEALLHRSGELGRMLALAAASVVTPAALDGAGVDPETYWRSLLQAYHWAIQVSRNL